MAEHYDPRIYEVSTGQTGLTLAAAIALAEKWAREHGGRATVWRHRPWPLPRRLVHRTGMAR